MIGTYWYVNYVNPNTGVDESHILKVISEPMRGVVRVACVFTALNNVSHRNTSPSLIKSKCRQATSEEIAFFTEKYNEYNDGGYPK